MIWHATWPLDEAAVRRVKRAVRRRQFLERLAAADDGSPDAWLEAIDRDDRTDPHEEQTVPALEVAA